MNKYLKFLVEFFSGMNGIFSVSHTDQRSLNDLFDVDMSDTKYIERSADKANLRADWKNVSNDIKKAHHDYCHK